MPLSNNYSLKTTEKDQRPCFICGKSSNSVLDAPDDFFFVCLSHTKDPGFCTANEVVEVTETETAKPDQSEEESKLAKNEQSIPKIVTYKLHRSILYLREEEKKKKDRLNLLKSLNKK